jgi:hypothetical protein
MMYAYATKCPQQASKPLLLSTPSLPSSLATEKQESDYEAEDVDPDTRLDVVVGARLQLEYSYIP